MKIIYVSKPSKCPFNCDDYCSNENGNVGNCHGYCNDNPDNLKFPDDCPLEAPPNSEQGEGDNSAALAVCIKLLETWKHAGPLGSNQFEKFDVVIREARKVVDESALPNGNTTHDTSKPSDICPACDGTGDMFVDGVYPFKLCSICDGTGKLSAVR